MAERKLPAPYLRLPQRMSGVGNIPAHGQVETAEWLRWLRGPQADAEVETAEWLVGRVAPNPMRRWVLSGVGDLGCGTVAARIAELLGIAPKPRGSGFRRVVVLGLAMSSDESEAALDLGLDDAEPGEGLSEEDRARASLGGRAHLGRFAGKCIGDDVSQKASRCLRVVALQTAGTGCDRYVWGRWWSSCLADLGADVGVLTETRTAGDAAHAAACQGMRDGGYAAISHNNLIAEPAARDGTAAGGMRASGVALAVRAGHSSGWTDVVLGPHGRAIAASLQLQGGVELRVVGLYGVSGACLPGFERREDAVRQEADLNAFVQQQAEWASQRSCLLVAAGDLNSIVDAALDVWEGTAQARASSLAATLQSCGLSDTFRARHPGTKGVTYVAIGGGSASRLDAICLETLAKQQLRAAQRKHCLAVAWGCGP